MEIGPQAVIGEAARFGITTQVPPYPSIYIGSADVIPLEMISAYSAFANLGTRTTPYAIERVEDRNGNFVWAPEPRSRGGDGPGARLAMIDGLRDVVRRGTAASAVGSPVGTIAGWRQDRHHQRRHRRLVHRLYPRPRRRRLDRVGQAAEDHGQRAGRPARRAGLDRHDEGDLRAPARPRRLAPARRAHVRARSTGRRGYKFTPFCPKDSLSVESFIPGTEPKTSAPSTIVVGPRGQPPAPVRIRCTNSTVSGVVRRYARAWVLPVDGPPVAGGAVLLAADGRIAAVGPDAAVPDARRVSLAERFDGAALLPGLVNTHTHLELTGLDGQDPRGRISPPGSGASSRSRRRDPRLTFSRPLGRAPRLLGGRRHHRRRYR